MSDEELLGAISEIRDLLRLIAEPQIAARDKKLRDDLIRVVGSSVPKRKAVCAMDGNRGQIEIHKETGINKGHLSTLVKELTKSQIFQLRSLQTSLIRTGRHMGEDLKELLETVRKIHGLLELLAEEKIAERDAKHRETLRQIVGASSTKQKSVFLMDGKLTQKEIRVKTAVHQGHLSTMVGKMHKANLLEGDTKNPKLVISIPANFFEPRDR